MFLSHPDFDAPDDSDILWRYLDLPRYLDLLIREKLFFPCANVLEDPFEGMFWGENRLHLRSRSAPLLAISSWHKNQQENYAMWKIYAQGYNGLAIQTNFRRLRESLGKTDMEIRIGKVSYTDEEPPEITNDNLRAVLHKRSTYSFEQEVRCCYKLDSSSERDHVWEEQGHVHGVYVPVDLEMLIERLYISPYSPNWFRELVCGVNKRFDIKKEIVHSGVFPADL